MIFFFQRKEENACGKNVEQTVVRVSCFKSIIRKKETTNIRMQISIRSVWGAKKLTGKSAETWLSPRVINIS